MAWKNNPAGEFTGISRSAGFKRSHYSIGPPSGAGYFSPQRDLEKTRRSKHVVFPTGAGVTATNCIIYYGAADARIAAVSMSLSGLDKQLINNLSSL